MRKVLGGVGCLLLAACPGPKVPDEDGGSTDAGVYMPVDCRLAPPNSFDAGTRADGGAQISLPKLTGRFGVSRGVRRVVYDATRDELDTPAPNDKRSISVEVWYPTDVCPEGAPPEYLHELEVQALMIPAGDPWWRTAGVHSTARAPFVADGERHPVLLFSSGYGGLARTVTELVEEVVSHGYVVVLISHTYWDPVTIFGSTGVAGFHSPFGVPLETLDDESEVWFGDAEATIESLTTWDASDSENELTGRLDLTKVGAFGHSFGGAMALNVLGRDARVKSAINLDGTQYGSERDAGGPVLSKPSLIFMSERAADSTLESVFTRSTGPAWNLVLKQSGHFSFLDFGLINPQFAVPLPPAYYGTIDPQRGYRVIADYVVAFFDRSLNGDAGALLDATSAQYPEVQFRKRP